MKKEIIDFIYKVVQHNEYLNGKYDFYDGDILAVINQPQKFLHPPVEFSNLQKLYLNVINYDGTYKYEDLFLFSDIQYGIFIYKYPDYVNYIEHFSHSISFQNFEKRIKEVLDETSKS